MKNNEGMDKNINNDTDEVYRMLKEAEKENFIKDAMIGELLSDTSSLDGKITDWRQKYNELKHSYNELNSKYDGLRKHIETLEKVDPLQEDNEEKKVSDIKDVRNKEVLIPTKKRRNKVVPVLLCIIIMLALPIDKDNIYKYIRELDERYNISSTIVSKFSNSDNDSTVHDVNEVISQSKLFGSKVIKRGEANSTYINFYLDDESLDDLNGLYREDSIIEIMGNGDNYTLNVYGSFKAGNSNEYKDINKNIVLSKNVKIVYSNYCSEVNVSSSDNIRSGLIDEVILQQDSKYIVRFDYETKKLDIKLNWN